MRFIVKVIGAVVAILIVSFIVVNFNEFLTFVGNVFESGKSYFVKA